MHLSVVRLFFAMAAPPRARGVQLETQLRQRSSLALGAEHRRAFAMAPTCRVLLPPRHLIPIAGCYCCSATFAQTVPSWGGGDAFRGMGWVSTAQRQRWDGLLRCRSPLAHLLEDGPPIGMERNTGTHVCSISEACNGRPDQRANARYIPTATQGAGRAHPRLQTAPAARLLHQPTHLPVRKVIGHQQRAN